MKPGLAIRVARLSKVHGTAELTKSECLLGAGIGSAVILREQDAQQGRGLRAEVMTT